MRKILSLLFFVLTSILSLNLKQDPSCDLTPIIPVPIPDFEPEEVPLPEPEDLIPEGDNSNGDGLGASETFE